MTANMDQKRFGGGAQINEHGFVRVVDTMGDDAAIVQAARVSYGDGTKTVNEDRGLIRYLMRHRHTTPFEMCEIKFHLKMPIFVARQWFRHRTASINEYSGRYSEMKDEFYLPPLKRIAGQSDTNKQGSGDALAEGHALEIQESMQEEQEIVRKNYEHYLDEGVARELARVNLPLSQYTECYWKIDLHNLFHFLSLRMDSHAQSEIRDFAIAMADAVKIWCPMAWEAFEDYILGSQRLGRIDQDMLKWLVGYLDASNHLEDVINNIDFYLDKYVEEKSVSISKGEKREIAARLTAIFGV